MADYTQAQCKRWMGLNVRTVISLVLRENPTIRSVDVGPPDGVRPPGTIPLGFMVEGTSAPIGSWRPIYGAER